MNSVTNCLFFTILSLVNRRTELQRLVIWAKRKRLTGPRRLYEYHLFETEARLSRYDLQHRKLTTLAIWFHRLNCLLLPEPRHIYKGAASQYRMKRLTPRIRKTYSY